MNTDYTRQVKQVLLLILLANWLVAFTKIAIGIIIQSASMTADGFHSLTDGASNVVGLIGMSFAAKPVDQSHPYGHKKYEFLTSLFIGAMLLIIAAEICLEAVDRIVEPVVPQFGPEAIAALVATLAINIAVCKYETYKGKQLSSTILISDSLHTKSDIYVSIGVLLTLTGIKAGAPPIIDPIASLIVGGFIIFAGIRIIQSTSAVLTDKAAVDHELVKNIVLCFPRVINVHKIRSRGSEQELFIDMHLIIEPTMTLEESHRLVHDIEDKLKLEICQNIQAMIHTEPQVKR